MDNDKKNDEKNNKIEDDSEKVGIPESESKVFETDEEAEAYLAENLDDDWDEGFDYGDDEEQETSK